MASLDQQIDNLSEQQLTGNAELGPAVANKGIRTTERIELQSHSGSLLCGTVICRQIRLSNLRPPRQQSTRKSRSTFGSMKVRNLR